MLLHCILLVILFVRNHSKTKAKAEKYGMVIDAGSTKTQLFIYRFSCDLNPKLSPIQIAFSESKDPIAILQSQAQCDSLISSLINFAKTHLEDYENEWNNYPIYLKATAGMRILDNPKKQKILEWIQTSFLNLDLNPFLYDDELNKIIISGKEESMFDWFAVNLLYNKLKNHDTIYDVSDQFIPDTLGILDLGGQSTQIAFMTNNGLYENSFLGYGTIGIEQKIAQFVSKHKDYNIYNNDVPYNPCLNNGYNEAYNDKKSIQFGSSSNDTSLCSQLIINLLSLDLSLHIPQSVPSNMKFIASRAFGYAYDDLGRPKNMDLQLLYDLMLDICGMTMDQLKQSKWNKNNDIDEKYLNKLCLLTNYIYVLLHKIYGFDLNNRNIEWTNEHNGKAISWAKGFILTHLNDNMHKYCLYDDNAINMVNILKRDNDNVNVNFHGYTYNASNEQPRYFVIAFLFFVCLCIITTCMVIDKIKQRQYKYKTVQYYNNAINEINV